MRTVNQLAGAKEPNRIVEKPTQKCKFEKIENYR